MTGAAIVAALAFLLVWSHIQKHYGGAV